MFVGGLSESWTAAPPRLSGSIWGFELWHSKSPNSVDSSLFLNLLLALSAPILNILALPCFES